MNASKRIVCNINAWRHTLTTVFPRTTAPGKCRPFPSAQSQKRSRTTDAKHDPVTDKSNNSRLSAIDLARKIREKAKAQATQPPTQTPLSTQQKRVMDLKRFSTQLQNVHPNVLAKHLHRSLLYQDNDVVVINKPYGVPVRDDTGVTSICSVLPVLSKMITGNNIKSDLELLPCLGLEKEACGALLLAKRAEVVENILNFQRNNEIQMTYWVITVGVPVPSKGVIDIPIIEREVTGPQPHYKMALSPLYKMNDNGDGLTKVRAHRQSHSAVTKYRVLDSSGGCSLVELQPSTSVKHQIRVHMALGLTCPILGDHKYSHWNKLAPQKLPERVLKKLGLEQSKSRHLPLHLLARQLTLPGVNPTGVNVRCPAPKYFTQASNLLQLELPFKDQQD